jgi:hypothetical protein
MMAFLFRRKSLNPSNWFPCRSDAALETHMMGEMSMGWLISMALKKAFSSK